MVHQENCHEGKTFKGEKIIVALGPRLGLKYVQKWSDFAFLIKQPSLSKHLCFITKHLKSKNAFDYLKTANYLSFSAKKYGFGYI